MISSPLRLVVLIPHKESLTAFNKYRRALFSDGVASALLLPAVAPLACVDAPLPSDALKQIARDIRAASLQNNGMMRATLLSPCMDDEQNTVTFRSAALANMIILKNDTSSFEWKIGRLFWLPSVKKVYG